MNDLNKYLKENFDKLQLSHQNFTPASVNTDAKGAKAVGNIMNSKYRLVFLRFGPFYKPISNYMK